MVPARLSVVRDDADILVAVVPDDLTGDWFGGGGLCREATRQYQAYEARDAQCAGKHRPGGARFASTGTQATAVIAIIAIAVERHKKE